MNNITKIIDFAYNFHKNENTRVEYVEKASRLAPQRVTNIIQTNVQNTSIDYRANTVRQNMDLCYRYFVKSDLIHCVILAIVNEVTRKRYKIVNINPGKSNQADTRQIKYIQRAFDQLNIDAVLSATVGPFALFGTGLIWIKKDKNGDIARLEPISFNNVEIYTKADEYAIDYFRYKLKNKEEKIPFNDVVYILPAMVDPCDTLRGVPRLMACVDALRCQEELYLYIYNLLRNGNYDGIYVNFNNTTEGVDDGRQEQVMADLKRALSDPSMVGSAIITQNAEFQTSAKSRQTPFENVPDITGKQVSRAFGVPEKFINLTKAGALGSNMAVDDRERMDEAVFSYDWPICDAITRKVLHEQCGLYNYALVPVKKASPVSLDAARAISTAYNDNAMPHEEMREQLGFPVNENDKFNGLFASEIEAKFGPKANNQRQRDTGNGDGNNSDTESARQQNE